MNRFIILLLLIMFTSTANGIYSILSRMKGRKKLLASRDPELGDMLPDQSECGILREDQFFNLQPTIEYNEFPWMATIKILHTSIETDSVLISKQFIMSSAHFFTRIYKLEAYLVYLGSCRLNDQCMFTYNLESVKVHPAYISNEASSDISLLRLKQTVIFAPDILPICLPSPGVDNINFVAQHLIVVGRHKLSRSYAKSFVLITDLKRCGRAYSSHVLDQKLICASTCYGGTHYAAGTALMDVTMAHSVPDRYYLVGLLTAGTEFCYDNTPDIFQRIDRSTEWITQSMVELERDAAAELLN